MGDADRISKAASTPETVAQFRRPCGQASYPRRMTLELDEKRYQWLRQVPYDRRVPAAAILRAAIDVLAADSDHCAVLMKAAQTEFPGPEPPH